MWRLFIVELLLVDSPHREFDGEGVDQIDPCRRFSLSFSHIRVQSFSLLKILLRFLLFPKRRFRPPAFVIVCGGFWVYLDGTIKIGYCPLEVPKGSLYNATSIVSIRIIGISLNRFVTVKYRRFIEFSGFYCISYVSFKFPEQILRISPIVVRFGKLRVPFDGLRVVYN